jgi:hypothetical protein
MRHLSMVALRGYHHENPRRRAMELNRPIVINRFRAELTSFSRLRMEGTIGDDATRDEVRRRLKDVHQYILTTKLSRFVVDVHSLDYVDSSAIRIFADLMAQAEASGYVVSFLIDSRVTWQRLSFSVLQTLAPRRVELEDVRGAFLSP